MRNPNNFETLADGTQVRIAHPHLPGRMTPLEQQAEQRRAVIAAYGSLEPITTAEISPAPTESIRATRKRLLNTLAKQGIDINLYPTIN
jgi:hypothetical protein